MEQQVIKYVKSCKAYALSAPTTGMAIGGGVVFCLVLIITLLFKCKSTPSISGDYVARVAYGTEFVSFFSGGTFQQTVTLTDGRHFNSFGTWEIFGGDCALHGAFLFGHPKMMDTQIPRRGSRSLPIRGGGSMLIINQDEDWYFRKVSTDR